MALLTVAREVIAPVLNTGRVCSTATYANQIGIDTTGTVVPTLKTFAWPL